MQEQAAARLIALVPGVAQLLAVTGAAAEAQQLSVGQRGRGAIEVGGASRPVCQSRSLAAGRGEGDAQLLVARRQWHYPSRPR